MYGVPSNSKATKHFVDIKWAIPDEQADSKAIIYLSPIKFQCSCGRFTYFYRYIATKGGFALGIQENRFPEIRNRMLKGVLCKHLIKVMTTIPNNGFFDTFERHIKSSYQGKKARVTKTDRRKEFE